MEENSKWKDVIRLMYILEDGGLVHQNSKG